MGKKNKKLKKKHHSYQPAVTIAANIQPTAQSATAPAADQIEVREPQIAQPEPAESSEFKYVKSDIKKILLIMLIIVIILIALYIVGSKTTYLTTAGSWFYKILNIQTQ